MKRKKLDKSFINKIDLYSDAYIKGRYKSETKSTFEIIYSIENVEDFIKECENKVKKKENKKLSNSLEQLSKLVEKKDSYNLINEYNEMKNFSEILLKSSKNEEDFICFLENTNKNYIYKLLNHFIGNNHFSGFLSGIKKNYKEYDIFTIRTGKNNEYHDTFIKDKFISLTWSGIDDVSRMTKEEVKEYSINKYDKNCYKQFNNFLFDIKIGDVVLILQKGTKFVDVVVITSEVKYCNDCEKRFSNYRTIEILHKNVEFDFIYNIQKTISVVINEENFWEVEKFVSDNRELYNEIINNLKDDEADLKTNFISNYNQLIIDGAPGTGKSYYVKNNLVDESKDYINRVTFYPDYEYHDFIGSIMPQVKTNLETGEESITYQFIKGHFTQTLEEALLNPEKKHFLIIEELTRGNAATIFGDVFQLLDRNDEGWSMYPINNDSILSSLDESASSVLHEKCAAKVVIPPNMSIICTVNSSDQNVYPLDTAFKRRFNYKIMDINNCEGLEDFDLIIAKEYNIGKWKDVYKNLNKYILSEMGLREDKQIGPFFIQNPGSSVDKRIDIKTKLAMYLWNDINKVHTSANKKIFKDKVSSLSEVNQIFLNGEETDLHEILTDDFRKFMNDKSI